MITTLANSLENDIIFGVYAPGFRLTEDVVMEHYDTKRHTVRAAFSVLKTRGLLMHKPNRGVEVISFTPDDVDALYGLRIILESAAADLTSLPVDSNIIKDLEEISRNHQSACESKDFHKIFALNKEFHRIQYGCCDNIRLVALIEEQARLAQTIRVVKYDDAVHMRGVVAQHFDIIDAMRGHSKSTYVQATRKHLPASADAFRLLYKKRFGK